MSGHNHGVRTAGWGVLAVCVLMGGALVGCESRGDLASSDWQRGTREDAFQQGIDRPPTARTLYAMARLLVGQGKDAEATFVLGELVRKHPDFRPAYVALAEIHMRHRRADEAMRVLETGLTHAPDDPVLLNDLGMGAMLKADYAAALDYFERAAAAAPDDARYRANLAVALGMLGRYDEALETYKQVMPLGEAYYNLGVLCQANSDLARAVEAFRQAEKAGYHHEPPAQRPGRRG